jgi:hypothetical protein
MSKKPPKNFHSLVKPLELVLKFRRLKMNRHSQIVQLFGVCQSMAVREQPLIA